MNRSYKIAVPMMNSVITEKYREKFLSQLKDADASRVFICDDRLYLLPDAMRRERLEALRENVAYFKANGLEVGIWFSPMGHGGALNHVDLPEQGNFTRVTGFNGGTCEDSFCIEDPEYAAVLYEFLRDLALCRPHILLLDDDLRLSGRSYGLGCTCEHHLRRFEKKTGLKVSREGLYEKLFAGGPTPMRTAWLDAQGESMLDFCRNARRAVDAVDPTIRLGFCACNGSWDVDGTDVIDMTLALAGTTAPLLRGIGAPYWAPHLRNPSRLADVIGYQRLQARWVRDRHPEIEFFTEGDLYPRPRYRVPAWLAEGYDTALRADGTTDGILKYMSDYTHYPDYEQGYFARHRKNRPLHEAFSAAFAGKRPRGVFIWEAEKKLRDSRFDEASAPRMDIIAAQSQPPAIRMMNRASVPTAFEENGDAVCVFGESARHIPLDLLRSGCILDAHAAQILDGRGADLGFTSLTEIPVPAYEQFPEYASFDAERIRPETAGIFYTPVLKPGAIVMSEFIDGEKRMPAAWCYENADGIRAFILPFVGLTVDSNSPAVISYARQEQLHAAIEFVQKRPLPASVKGEPDVFLMVSDTATERAVGVWNFSDDVLLTPGIKLDGEWESVTFLRGEGMVCDNTVRFSCDIPAHDLALFILKK